MKLLIYCELREKQIYDTTALTTFSFDCDQPKQIMFQKMKKLSTYKNEKGVKHPQKFISKNITSFM